MSALTIYGDRRSGNCLKGKWVADALGVPNQWVDIDIMKGESRTASFLAMNPAGQVPVAVFADGRKLAQSNAIMLHLAEDSRLIPEDGFARAKMFEWLFWEQYSHEPTIAVRRFLMAFKHKSEADIEAEAPGLRIKGEAALARLELQLQQTPYLVGAALSLADIACVAYTRVAHEGGFDLNAYPAVRAWVARVEGDLHIAPGAATSIEAA
jgi:glutathione S-transferase